MNTQPNVAASSGSSPSSCSTADDHAKADDVEYRRKVFTLQKLKNEVGNGTPDGSALQFRNPAECYGFSRLFSPGKPTRPWPVDEYAGHIAKVADETKGKAV